MEQVAGALTRSKLNGSEAFGEAWRVYKRLFGKSVLLGAIVFGALDLLTLAAFALLSVNVGTGVAAALVTAVLGFSGAMVLEGALIEIVRPLHVDGDAEPTLAEVWQRANSRFGALLGSSLLASLVVAGVALVSFAFAFVALKAVGGIAALLFVAAFFATMTAAMRVSLTMPVVMLEEASATESLKRSNDLVRGNAWQIFCVLVGAGIVASLIQLPFDFVASSIGTLGVLVVGTAGKAVAQPLVAHAMTVMYYRLAEPTSLVVLAPGQKNWQSIWAEERAAAEQAQPAQQSSVWDEYQQRWG